MENWMNHIDYKVDDEGNVISHGKIIVATKFIYADGSLVLAAPRPLEVIDWYNRTSKYVVRAEPIFKS